MKGLPEAEIAAFVKGILDKTYAHLIGGRFFQGTILTAQQQTSSAGFLCTLSRTSEVAGDGNTYLCSTPGYTPRAGDVVECVWLEPTVGLILWPIGGIQLGNLGYAQAVQNQTPITAEVDLTGLTVTVPAASGRKLRISWQMIAYSSVDADAVELQCYDTFQGVTTVVGQHWFVNRGVNQNQSLSGFAVVIPTPGTHVYKLTLRRFAGTGNVTVAANSGAPASISVDGMGG